MEEIEQGTAELVAWDTPEGQPVSLRPRYDGGRLEVRIRRNAVTLKGKLCIFTWCDAKTREKAGEKNVEDVHFTVPLQSCNITWKFIEAKPPSGIHRKP